MKNWLARTNLVLRSYFDDGIFLLLDTSTAVNLMLASLECMCPISPHMDIHTCPTTWQKLPLRKISHPDAYSAFYHAANVFNIHNQQRQGFGNWRSIGELMIYIFCCITTIIGICGLWCWYKLGFKLMLPIKK